MHLLVLVGLDVCLMAVLPIGLQRFLPLKVFRGSLNFGMVHKGSIDELVCWKVPYYVPGLKIHALNLQVEDSKPTKLGGAENSNPINFAFAAGHRVGTRPKPSPDNPSESLKKLRRDVESWEEVDGLGSEHRFGQHGLACNVERFSLLRGETAGGLVFNIL